MKENKPMDITYEQELEFRQSTRCLICNKNFKPDDEKVRDHCHFSGQYRGAAHVKCNFDYLFKFFKIPVFFHNLKKGWTFDYQKSKWGDDIVSSDDFSW